MWPWGHAAVGYLWYSSARRWQGRIPAGPPVLALAVGTQFPDLVDKPLGWTLGVLPGGRSLAHSLVTLALVAAVAGYLGYRFRGRDASLAFVSGTLSHVLADGLYPVLEGRYADLSYLLWPILPVPEAEVGKSFLAHVAQLTLDSYVTFELALLVFATVLWWADGRPGLGTLWATGARWVDRLVSHG
ncbi:metal-dependent hydrolase [Halomicroarcula sp. S1AR25-4]|uniref:metal-dependent hydrolase n=1 Tax=Haloarcula sp. S1AR25-4 TaxID=2950538 RepID=UPI0028758076|nr:metal-dependent hydrolase [Halomicroarcula sp. S1AR25-4]MDS0278521.1 metal-dependent hydrolase [Halomicroarcula sp. S1AR25-4]